MRIRKILAAQNKQHAQKLLEINQLKAEKAIYLRNTINMGQK